LKTVNHLFFGYKEMKIVWDFVYWIFKLCSYTVSIAFANYFLNLDVVSLLFSRQFKSSLYSLNTLSGVTSERWPFPRICARAIGGESLV